MRLVEPNEESYALWINEVDFTAFDLFYTELGYRTIGGKPLKQFVSHCGYFIVDKKSKTIGFMENCMFSVYQNKEYAIRELIEFEKGIEN